MIQVLILRVLNHGQILKGLHWQGIVLSDYYQMAMSNIPEKLMIQGVNVNRGRISFLFLLIMLMFTG